MILGLPFLEAMIPARLKAAEAAPRRRMVAIRAGLGLYSPHFFPRDAGRDYRSTPYLDLLAGRRRDLTVFSGLSHPAVDGDHASEASFLTAAPHPGSTSFRNTISLDQLAAEQLAADTRFSYLSLTTLEGESVSWTRGGVMIPADSRPSQVFARLFLEGTAAEVQAQVRRLREGRSILDTVLDEARSMDRQLGKRDRDKLDQFFTSVRGLEGRLVKAEEWAKKPKRRVDAAPPRGIFNAGDTIGRTRLMYDLIHLALQTDSTRLAALSISKTNLVPPIPGITGDWHNLSHHGNDPGKIEELILIEREHLKALRDFLTRLAETKEDESTLLERTIGALREQLGQRREPR